jgi:hypothetical protein
VRKPRVPVPLAPCDDRGDAARIDARRASGLGDADKESSMRNRWMISAAAWAVFTAYTVKVVIEGGPLGFVSLHLSHAWGMQVIVDLVLAAIVALLYVSPQARAVGVRPAPYVLATITLGSVGLLAFVTHVEWARQRRAEAERAKDSDQAHARAA